MREAGKGCDRRRADPNAAIQAPLHAPAPHPHDRALLRPLASLGKPKFSDSSVSFLRRTEYISAHTSRSKFESTTSRSLVNTTGVRHKRARIQNVDRESPEGIKNDIEKSFDVARSSLLDSNKVKHPTKRNVKLVESYPILPDLDAIPANAGYISYKFLTNPVAPAPVYDRRLESGILRFMAITAAEEAIQAAAREAYEVDPHNNPPPVESMNLDLYLLQDKDTKSVTNLKRKCDLDDPERDSEDLYSSTTEKAGGNSFPFTRIRAYESAAIMGDLSTRFEDEIAIGVNDGRDGKMQKAVYYYPIVQRVQIRPQRTRNMDRMKYGSSQAEENDDLVDILNLRLREPTEEEVAKREEQKDVRVLRNEMQPGGEEEIGVEEQNGSASLVQDEQDAEGESDN